MSRSSAAELQAAMQDQIDAAAILRLKLEDSLTALEDAEEVLRQELEDANAGPGKGRFADAGAPAAFKKMKEDTGISPMYASVPPRASESEDYKKQSVRHMAAVINGRGEGADINLVEDALH